MTITQFFTKNYQWVISLVIGGILIPFVRSFLQRRHKYKTDIYVTEAWDRHFFNIEIFNSGTEDILELQSDIYWKQDGKEEKGELIAYISENEDQLWVTPHNCKVLRQGEKKIAVNIPRYSDNGKIKVIVKGVGTKSRKKINKEFFINNKIKNK